MSRMGLKVMVIALGGMVAVGILVKVSLQNLSYAIIGWFLAMGPARTVGMVTMPGLPDFSIDRIMLIWIVGILALRLVTGKTRLTGPFTGDALVIVQVLYIWAQMQYLNNLEPFHTWLLSSFSPMFGFIYGKYVVNDEKLLKNIVLFFFVLSIYYYLTAIAEHFHWTILIWPKTILNPDLGFWMPGRARGPVLHPPLLMQLANSDFFQERMNAQNTVENRLGFLANAYRMIKDHPFFGIGFFQYMEQVGHYNQTSYIPFYGMVKKGLSDDVPIHDIYLGRTAEEGFVGIGLVFWFYFVIFKSWLSLWRRNLPGDWFNRDLLALFAGMMVCYLVGGMIIDYRYFDFINVVFYFQAGIIYGHDLRLKNQDKLLVA